MSDGVNKFIELIIQGFTGMSSELQDLLRRRSAEMSDEERAGCVTVMDLIGHCSNAEVGSCVRCLYFGIAKWHHNNEPYCEKYQTHCGEHMGDKHNPPGPVDLYKERPDWCEYDPKEEQKVTI